MHTAISINNYAVLNNYVMHTAISINNYAVYITERIYL